MNHEALINSFHPSLGLLVPVNLELFIILFLYPLLILVFFFVTKNLLDMVRYLVIDKRKGLKAGRINTIFYLYSISFILLLGLGLLLIILNARRSGLAFGFDFPTPVNAQLLPKSIQDNYGFGVPRTNYNLLQSPVLGFYLTVMLIYSLAFNYISHLFFLIQGLKGKFNLYSKSVKRKFYLVLAISILSIPNIFVLIPNAYLHRNAINPDLSATCLYRPNSAGCYACKESIVLIYDNSQGNRAGTKQELCQYCNKNLMDSFNYGNQKIDPLCK